MLPRCVCYRVHCVITTETLCRWFPGIRSWVSCAADVENSGCNIISKYPKFSCLFFFENKTKSEQVWFIFNQTGFFSSANVLDKGHIAVIVYTTVSLERVGEYQYCQPSLLCVWQFQISSLKRMGLYVCMTEMQTLGTRISDTVCTWNHTNATKN